MIASASVCFLAGEDVVCTSFSATLASVAEAVTESPPCGTSELAGRAGADSGAGEEAEAEAEAEAEVEAEAVTESPPCGTSAAAGRPGADLGADAGAGAGAPVFCFLLDPEVASGGFRFLVNSRLNTLKYSSTVWSLVP